MEERRIELVYKIKADELEGCFYTQSQDLALKIMALVSATTKKPAVVFRTNAAEMKNASSAQTIDMAATSSESIALEADLGQNGALLWLLPSDLQKIWSEMNEAERQTLQEDFETVLVGVRDFTLNKVIEDLRATYGP